jgi:hypothetical protein
MCNDYGPATKLLGLEEIKLNDNDIIIILDDDMKYNLYLTTYYALGYQLFKNIDGLAIIDRMQNIIFNKNKIKYLFYNKIYDIYSDNYNELLAGWLSFSFRYKFINDIIKESKILLEDKEIFKHDDLIFTYCYKKLKLNLYGLNMYFSDIDIINQLKIDNDSLRLDNIKNLNYRKKLENKYDFDYDQSKYKTYNDSYNIQILGKRLFLITIETKIKNIYKELNINLNNKYINLPLYLKYNIQTLFYKTNFDLI